MKINFTLVLLFFCGLTMSAQQDFSVNTGKVGEGDTCVKNIFLDQVMVTAEKIKAYRDYKYVMVDFEIADDKFFILQRKENSLKNFRVLVTNMVFEPLDTIAIPEKIKPINLEFDIADNIQIVTQDSLYQIIEVGNKYYYAFPIEKNHYREVLRNCLFMTDRFVYFCDTKADGYLLNFYRIDPKAKTNEIIFRNNDVGKLAEIPQEVSWHAAHTAKVCDMWIGPSPEQWEMFMRNSMMRPDQAYLGHSRDILYYFDHKNRKIETYDEDLNLLNSCSITYPDDEAFWRHKMYQDRVTGKFYTVFGTTLNEIDVKTGKTIPKISANNYLSQKIIIYKGNLYSLKKRRDSSNAEISYIEKTKIN